jgi:hypothetical protein
MAKPAEKQLAQARAELKLVEEDLAKAERVAAEAQAQRDQSLADPKAYARASEAFRGAEVEVQRLTALLSAQLVTFNAAERDVDLTKLAELEKAHADAMLAVKNTGEEMGRRVAAVHAAKLDVNAAVATATELRAGMRDLAAKLGVPCPLQAGIRAPMAVAFAHHSALLHELAAVGASFGNAGEASTRAWLDVPDASRLLEAYREAFGLSRPPAQMAYSAEAQVRDLRENGVAWYVDHVADCKLKVDQQIPSDQERATKERVEAEKESFYRRLERGLTRGLFQ